MKKLIPLLVLFSACTKDDVVVPQKNYTFSIDSVLTQNGTKSLPKDANGYYHLKLIPKSNQQPHRITGRLLVNGKEPYPAENVEFESNLYWWLRRGDTVAYITKSYINYFTGQYTIVNLPPMITNKDELVPTINKSSYSGTKGEVNTIIAPISEMIGDTMIVKAFHWESKKSIYTKIILE
jgi:hypothetical protein